MSFGAQLTAEVTRCRRQSGIDQYTFAARLGVLRGQVSKWETARQHVPLDLLPAISSTLGLSIEEMVTRARMRMAARSKR